MRAGDGSAVVADSPGSPGTRTQVSGGEDPGQSAGPPWRAFVSTSSAKKLPVARGTGVSQLLIQNWSSYSPVPTGESESSLTGGVPPAVNHFMQTLPSVRNKLHSSMVSGINFIIMI